VILPAPSRVPGHSRQAAAGLSGAALAGSDAEQPTAAGDIVRGPRA
jgi:hypothetical protein